jgi:hypothetical protein
MRDAIFIPYNGNLLGLLFPFFLLGIALAGYDELANESN